MNELIMMVMMIAMHKRVGMAQERNIMNEKGIHLKVPLIKIKEISSTFKVIKTG